MLFAYYTYMYVVTYSVNSLFTGKYRYIEASRPRVPGDAAVLESRMFTPKGFERGACVNFWYHMKGTDIGDLNIYVGNRQVKYIARTHTD